MPGRQRDRAPFGAGVIESGPGERECALWGRAGEVGPRGKKGARGRTGGGSANGATPTIPPRPPGRAADQASRPGAGAGMGATNANAARTASGTGSASIRPVASWRTCTVVILPRATSVHLPARSF